MQPSATRSKAAPGALGFLRHCHLAMVAALVLAAPFVENGDGAHSVLLPIVAPALMPILLFTLLLDVLFCWIRKQDPQPPETLARLRFITRLNLVALLVLVVAWLPFIARLVG